uniref:Gonadoliberin-1 n=1 Tax=Petromyzon marinus TaxID=7757 RepID=GON1_PETMA|nr:RecName: Full=Gonadoliberin-1; AltName: Full=Gonadoliberin I; AltName: Full=Gonadotropin-releasing hormone I; Short=GnRH-I; AltName: Full=Luliberin I [Petromyzon marinus]
QHYSLEWKPG